MIYYIEDLLDKKEEGRALEMDESLNRQSRGKVWFGALGILLSVAVGGALCSRGLYLLSLFDALSVSARSLLPVQLFLCFGGALLLQGFAAGWLSGILIRYPSSFFPHVFGIYGYLAYLGIGYLLTGQWLAGEAIGGVMFYVSGFLLFRAKASGQSKTACVLFASVPAMVLSGLVFLFHALSVCGVSFSALSAYLGRVQDACTTLGKDTVSYILEILDENAVLSSLVEGGILPKTATVAELEEYLVKAYGSVYSAFLLILPGILVAISNIAGYLSVCIQKKNLGEAARSSFLSVRGFGIGLFLFSMLFSYFFSSGIFGTVLLNLRISYMPLMFGLGVGTLRKVKKESIRQHPFLTMITVLIILFSPVTMISLIGAYGAMNEKMMKRLNNLNGGGQA